jgi:alpha-beta hydrolase superfamily lysophospholipase
MTEPVTRPAVRSWHPAEGLHHRGTVLLLPGRGEHGGVYERLGRRLSADAYVVHAADSTPDEDLATLARLVTETIADAAGPIVLAGSDTGALQALALAAGAGRTPDGVIVAGPADPGASSERPWAEELEARTACPTHRRRLTEDDRFVRGALAAPIPAALSAPPLDRVGAPVLVLHGDADPVTAPEVARSIAARLPDAELAIVRGGRHDVLNDVDHRSVAAHVVSWLERLRSGPDRAPIVEPLA